MAEQCGYRKIDLYYSICKLTDLLYQKGPFNLMMTLTSKVHIKADWVDLLGYFLLGFLKELMKQWGEKGSFS